MFICTYVYRCVINSMQFLEDLRELIVLAYRWSKTENSLSMIARSGRDFPRLPLSLRLSVIAAALTSQMERRDAAVKRRDLARDQARFMRDFNALMLKQEEGQQGQPDMDNEDPLHDDDMPGLEELM